MTLKTHVDANGYHRVEYNGQDISNSSDLRLAALELSIQSQTSANTLLQERLDLYAEKVRFMENTFNMVIERVIGVPFTGPCNPLLAGENKEGSGNGGGYGPFPFR